MAVQSILRYFSAPETIQSRRIRGTVSNITKPYPYSCTKPFKLGQMLDVEAAGSNRVADPDRTSHCSLYGIWRFTCNQSKSSLTMVMRPGTTPSQPPRRIPHYNQRLLTDYPFPVTTYHPKVSKSSSDTMVPHLVSSTHETMVANDAQQSSVFVACHDEARDIHLTISKLSINLSSLFKLVGETDTMVHTITASNNTQGHNLTIISSNTSVDSSWANPNKEKFSMERVTLQIPIQRNPTLTGGMKQRRLEKSGFHLHSYHMGL